MKERHFISQQEEDGSLLVRLGRYTFFVLWSKWSLAIFSCVLLVALVAWPLISREASGGRIAFVGVSETGSAVGSPSMENPRFQGVDAKGQQYTVTARRAEQQPGNNVQLHEVQGELLMQNQQSINLTAQRGFFTNQQQNLALEGGVTLTQSQGYVVNTPRADINTQTSAARGSDEITATGPLGNMLATGFEINDNGNHMKFGSPGNRVRVTVKKSVQP
jgi:lipopolysaccharide export system protein LptC